MNRALARIDTAAPLAQRPAISIHDLYKRFAGLTAIDGVSLDIARGEFFMIVGPSGCGKTTLLRILAGLALPVIMAGLKLGVGLGLVLIAVAEMMGAKSGLGYLIWSAWSTFAVEEMYVGLFVVAIIGFLLTLVFNELERIIIPWKSPPGT